MVRSRERRHPHIARLREPFSNRHTSPMVYDNDVMEREMQRIADLLEVHKPVDRLVRHGLVTQTIANHALDVLHMEKNNAI